MSNDNKIADTYEVSPAAGYAGDIKPETAWRILSEHKEAVLVDVRTRAEWNYVGLPDLAPLGKKPALIEWQVFPTMQVNPETRSGKGTVSTLRPFSSESSVMLGIGSMPSFQASRTSLASCSASPMSFSLTGHGSGHCHLELSNSSTSST